MNTSLFKLFAVCFAGSRLGLAATFTVVNTDDSGPGSFRQTLLDANATVESDSIHFNLPGPGPHTISPGIGLPKITRPVIIDGATQPGYAGQPLIELEGSGAFSTGYGLWITAGDSTVRGLAINRFGGRGSFQILLETKGTNTIVGNYIGLDVTGTQSFGGRRHGLEIASSDNLIGGADPSARNVISGTGDQGIVILGSRNRIQGNLIGTDVTGTNALPNLAGVFLIVGPSGQAVVDNVIGGTNRGEGNVISGNIEAGVFLQASRNVIQGNYVGTDLSGTNAMSNGSHGVLVNGNNNILAGNTIAFNGGDGVFIPIGNGNLIRGNRIFSNDGMGIDLGSKGVTANDPTDADTGANNLQNFPVLTLAANLGGSTTLSGSLRARANAVFNLDFFSTDKPDPTGYGQGQDYIGSSTIKTDATGNADFSETVAVAVPIGRFVTATATDSANNTSEFSECIAVTAGVSPPTLSVFKSPSGDALTIAWPASFAGFALEATENLAAPISWTAVTTAPVVVEDRNQVSVPLVEITAKFYRITRR